MLSRLFPKQLDNDYRGWWIGLVIFVLIAAVKGLQGANSVYIPEGILKGADGVPLDRFSPEAVQTAIAMGTLLGVHLMALPLLSLVVLIRYRAMIPLMLLLMLMLQLGLRAALWVYPIPRTSGDVTLVAGVPVGFLVNLVILALNVIGLVLSLQERRGRAAGDAAPPNGSP